MLSLKNTFESKSYIVICSSKVYFHLLCPKPQSADGRGGMCDLWEKARQPKGTLKVACTMK